MSQLNSSISKLHNSLSPFIFFQFTLVLATYLSISCSFFLAAKSSLLITLFIPYSFLQPSFFSILSSLLGPLFSLLIPFFTPHSSLFTSHSILFTPPFSLHFPFFSLQSSFLFAHSSFLTSCLPLLCPISYALTKANMRSMSR